MRTLRIDSHRLAAIVEEADENDDDDDDEDDEETPQFDGELHAVAAVGFFDTSITFDESLFLPSPEGSSVSAIFGRLILMFDVVGPFCTETSEIDERMLNSFY